MSFFDKLKQASKGVVDAGAKTMLKVSRGVALVFDLHRTSRGLDRSFLLRLLRTLVFLTCIVIY